MFKIITLTILILVITTITSYAYFTASIEGNENESSLSISGGTMKITYNGGSNINATQIISKEEAFATKTFTLTGNNTTGADMNYNISLVVQTNTFTDYALSYNLSLASKTGNGTPVPDSPKNMCYLLNGSQTEVLGSGLFLGPTSENEAHTYNLKLYFSDTGKPQNEDQGKTLTAYIKTEAGEKTASKCKLPANLTILADNGGKENITEAPTSLFASINTEDENKMYKMEDDYGDSYYFRGAKDYVNNNLIFAEHQWKIIRINGDGSLRIIYNGECQENQCEINTTGTGTHMMLPSSNGLYNSSGNTAYNLTNRDDAKYVGYMYGGANGEASTSREGATTNETSTNIKTYLDSWYEVNIKGKSYEKYIVDTLFCNDRQLRSEVGGAATGTGFGMSETNYAAFYRLITNKTPSIKCNNQNDRFTTTNYNNTIVPGNKALNYPIGLLTADEGALAGLKHNVSNLTNYLYTNQMFWTMSPSYFFHIDADVWYVSSEGDLDICYVYLAGGVRGVLNLASNTLITGAGTASEPYVVLD